MQMEISSRHFTMSDEQHEAIEEALGKLEKYSPRPVQSVRLTLIHEAGRFTADSVLHLKTTEFRAKEVGLEPEYAVTEVVEALRKQLTKFKGKISGKQKGEEGGLGRAMLDGGGIQDGEFAAAEGFVLKDMDVQSARDEFTSQGQPFLIFRNVETAKVAVIYRRVGGDLGHMESSND
ncbi:MAG: HPF/RaiA family ribosome-associated protein [Gemmatimonadales bacterium]|nr:HPF/RaiA family ribosome-associated protein [Gemmatimonadales bacterium]